MQRHQQGPTTEAIVEAVVKDTKAMTPMKKVSVSQRGRIEGSSSRLETRPQLFITHRRQRPQVLLLPQVVPGLLFHQVGLLVQEVPLVGPQAFVKMQLKEVLQEVGHLQYLLLVEAPRRFAKRAENAMQPALPTLQVVEALQCHQEGHQDLVVAKCHQAVQAVVQAIKLA